MHNRLRLPSLITFLSALIGYVVCVRVMMFPDSKGDSCQADTLFLLQKIATILLILAMLALIFSYYHWIIKSSLKDKIKNSLLSLVVVLTSLLALECIFLHHIESNAIGERWSYKLWDKKFIPHRTPFYYKDSNGNEKRTDLREPIFPIPANQGLIWFIGDSFTFGFGIEKTSQTFPDLIEKKLGNNFKSINLGEGGADTYKEFETITAFEKISPQPKAVVWSYFGNDIDANDEGPDLYEKRLAKNALIKLGQLFFKTKSFLLDYIYWEYFMKNEQGNIQTYIQFLNKLYSSKDDPESPYQRHIQPIFKAANHFKEKQIPFYVLIFPFLWEGGPENASNLYAKRLSDDLKTAGIEVIDLSPMAQKMKTEDRIVSVNDPHPSATFAKLAADTIFLKLKPVLTHQKSK